jgi:hypothetical protein
MHVTKGVFESTISLLLDIASKTKDGLNTRKDLQALGIREELHPQERQNEKVYLLSASYTFTVTPPNNFNKFGGVTMLQDNNKTQAIEI